MTDFEADETYYEQSERYVTRLNHELKRYEDQITGGLLTTLEEYKFLSGRILGIRCALDLFIKRRI